MTEGESPMNFSSHINTICHQNRYERGYQLSLKGAPVALPLPFPRIFTKALLTENGLFKQEDDRKKDEFVLSVPMMTRLA